MGELQPEWIAKAIEQALTSPAGGRLSLMALEEFLGRFRANLGFRESLAQEHWRHRISPEQQGTDVANPYPCFRRGWMYRLSHLS
jgi:hypothetical protein